MKWVYTSNYKMTVSQLMEELNMTNKVILITGASSGIGHDTAKALAEQGHIVYGAARRVEKMDDLKPLGVHPVKLDVTDPNNTKLVVNQILASEGHIDVLVNNAGYGSYGAVEDVPLNEARRQIDVNLLGVADMIKLVTPSMREQHSGTIINISSMAGKVWTPFGAWYHATKFAIEGFSNALRLELEPMGINVVIIEPGAIRTPWGTIAADNLEKVSGNGAYAKAARKTAANMRKMYQSSKMISDPSVITKTIVRAINATRPRTHYLIGFGAKPAVFASRIVSNRTFDKIIKRFM